LSFPSYSANRRTYFRAERSASIVRSEFICASSTSTFVTPAATRYALSSTLR
jgi:hypothetical protein